MLEEQEYADRMEIEKRTGRSVSEDMEKVCTEVLVNARNELYLRMRFLDAALSGFVYVMDMDIHGMGTDGFQMHYHPKTLGGPEVGSRLDLKP